jgi:hypothetical protein
MDHIFENIQMQKRTRIKVDGFGIVALFFKNLPSLKELFVTILVNQWPVL